MPLFGKKKVPEVEQTSYEIFGGFTITKNQAGYELKWKNPNPTSITVLSEPKIDKNVKTEREGDLIKILTTECKLMISKKGGSIEAHVSQLWGPTPIV
jgi:hypothetical protein